MRNRKRKLIERINRLRVPEAGMRAPLKIPWRLKRQWRRMMVQHLNQLGILRRCNLWWQPGVGWTIELKAARLRG